MSNRPLIAIIALFHIFLSIFVPLAAILVPQLQKDILGIIAISSFVSFGVWIVLFIMVIRDGIENKSSSLLIGIFLIFFLSGIGALIYLFISRNTVGKSYASQSSSPHDKESTKDSSFTYTAFSDVKGAEMSAIMNLEHTVNTGESKSNLYEPIDLPTHSTSSSGEILSSESYATVSQKDKKNIMDMLHKDRLNKQKERMLNSGDDSNIAYYKNGKPVYKKKNAGL